MSSSGEESFVGWLTKQMNSNVTLYLPHAARQYESNLRDVPPKLDVPINQNDEYEVFLCRTIAEFDYLRAMFWLLPTLKRLIEILVTGRFQWGFPHIDGIWSTTRNQKVKLSREVQKLCITEMENLLFSHNNSFAINSGIG